MEGLLLPVCSVFFSILLCTIFFFKKRLNLIENKLYSVMLICSVIDSIVVSILRIIALYNVTPFLTLISILNKIDFIQLIFIVSSLFLYTVVITFPNSLKNLKKIFSIIVMLNTIVIIFMLFLKVEVININNNVGVDGSAITTTYIFCAIYLISSMLIAISNFRKVDRRHIPIFAIIFIFIFLLFIYKYNPNLIVISITLTFINYLMYFTIENPDIKLLEAIKKSKDEVDKINIDKSNFLFDITEDMKKNLNQIDDYIDMNLVENDQKVIKENLYEAKSIINSAERTINNTLDISEEDALKIRKINNKYNIQNIIKQIIIQSQNKVNKNVEFRTDIENNLPEYLYGDSVKLKQILMTLIDNSIENTQEGFIELKISSVRKYNICRLIINVEDSGNGIDSKVVETIFSNDDENNDFMATHLNLKNVNKIIHLIGGTFNITSKVNYGTKVTVTLDQIIADLNNNKISEYMKDINLTKVLIISEDNVSTKRIKKVFDRNQINVEAITSGEQGLNKLRNNEKFDLIFIDYDLSKLSGLNTYIKLRDINKFKALVVMMVNEENQKLEEKAKEIGLYKLIKKPIKVDDIKTLTEVLKERH